MTHGHTPGIQIYNVYTRDELKERQSFYLFI